MRRPRRIICVDDTSPASPNGVERRGPALGSRDRDFGLRRRALTTAAGRVVVRAGTASGDTATILLHGGAGSWTTWTPLLRVAERSGHPLTDVIAIDLPGWGESPAAASGVDVAKLSALVRDVAQSLGYERWIVVGHSLGGFLALDIAARAPERTQAVLLISPAGPAVLEAIRHPLRGGLALPGFAGMLLAMRVLIALGALGRRLVSALQWIGVFRVLCAPLFARPAHVHPTVIRALSTELRPRALIDAARAAAGYDESAWRVIACPVRSIRGERDVFVADGDGIGFAHLIRDFDQTTVRDAGHFAAVERPEAVLQALRALAPAARVRAGA